MGIAPGSVPSRPGAGTRVRARFQVSTADFDVDGRIDLTLNPDFDDSTVLALGPPLTLTRWKVHGVIEGTVGLDDGSTLQVRGVRGAAEYVEIIW